MPPISEPSVTLAALVEYHHEVLAPDFQRVHERLDRMAGRIEGHFDEICHRFDHLETEYSAVQASMASIEERLYRIELRLDSIEQQRGRVPRRVADVLDRIDEIGLRFEGTENLLNQLAEQILELRTVGAVIVPPSRH